MSRYHPWRALSRMTHITFGITRLPAGQAWWLPDEQAIVLDDRLNRVQRRCALTHELVHAERGDRTCVTPVLEARQERRTHAEASRRLITLDDLFDGLLWAGWNDHDLAAHLDVDMPTLRLRCDVLTASERKSIDQRLRDAERNLA